MWKLNRDNSGRLEYCLQATYKIVKIWYVGENVVGRNQVRGRTRFYQSVGSFGAEKGNIGRNALLDRRFGHVGGRFYSEDRDAASCEELEQISVVACNL